VLGSFTPKHTTEYLYSQQLNQNKNYSNFTTNMTLGHSATKVLNEWRDHVHAETISI